MIAAKSLGSCAFDGWFHHHFLPFSHYFNGASIFIINNVFSEFMHGKYITRCDIFTILITLIK